MSVSDAIPPMTHELGRHWEQPPTSEILVDDTHALMGWPTFRALADYSASIPSGVYEGKMWKRHDGVYDKQFLRGGGIPEWLLMWFGPSADPNKCSINSRKILIVE